MSMKLEKLTIALKHSYSKPGPDNPYQATISASYKENSMQVTLGDETCKRILALAGDEIADAAQVQISEFVRTALSISETPLIEGETT